MTVVSSPAQRAVERVLIAVAGVRLPKPTVRRTEWCAGPWWSVVAWLLSVMTIAVGGRRRRIGRSDAAARDQGRPASGSSGTGGAAGPPAAGGGRPLVLPQKRYYEAGEIIAAKVKDVAGRPIGAASYLVLQKLGEGYAGQVYKAIDEQSGAFVAIKILKTESRRKQQLRDGFFRLCYGGNFLPAISEDAMRYGLIWQVLIRRGAKAVLGDESAVVRPIGYFWDDRLQVYAEIHEYIRGHVSTPDDPDRNDRKRAFVDAMLHLATDMGAYQLARQYDWWTLLASGNAIEREDGSYCAIDWRPGIALPWFLPLSPGDVRIIRDNLRRGKRSNFDAADFDRLDAFVAAHRDDFADLIPLIEDLKRVDRAYRSGYREATIADWLRSGEIDGGLARTLRRSYLAYRIRLFFDGIPQKALLRFASSALYREHVRSLVSDSTCRRLWIDAHRTGDIEAWRMRDRITNRKADELRQKPWLYALHKVFFAGSGLQKLTDNEELLADTRRLIDPVALIFSGRQRIQWMSEKIDKSQARKIITPEQAAVLQQDIRDGRMQGFLWELIGVNLCLELITNGAIALLLLSGEVYLAIGVFALAGSFLRFGYAALHRCLHEIPRALRQHDPVAAVASLVSIAISPVKGLGVLYPLPEIAIVYPEMSAFLMEYATTRAVRKIPVYGLEGGALEYYAFQIPREAKRVFRGLQVRLAARLAVST